VLQKPLKADALIATIQGVLSKPARSREKGGRMAQFVMRKNHRFKKLVPVRYLGEGVTSEGIIEDLSLSGSSINGNAPVPVGMALALQIFVPGDPDPLLIERAIVQWVNGFAFGVEFDAPPPKVAKRIIMTISMLVKAEYCSSRNE
jgi:PilZ domain